MSPPLDPRRRAFADALGRLIANQIWREITNGNAVPEAAGRAATASSGTPNARGEALSCSAETPGAE